MSIFKGRFIELDHRWSLE